MAILIVLVVVLGAMILHELAHGLVAYKLGDDTAKDEGRLTLNPVAHLDPWLSVALPLILIASGGPVFGGAKPVPINTRNLKGGAWGMALVALAGPATNIAIAFVAFLLGHFSGGLYEGGMGQYVWTQIVAINLGLAVFNLIPIPPLDGSRVLYALAPDAVRELMERMENWGIMLVLIIVVAAPQVTSAVISGGIGGILQVFYALVK